MPVCQKPVYFNAVMSTFCPACDMYSRLRNQSPPNKGPEMKNIEQITTGSASSVDPCALLLVNEFRATGTKAWLGFPSQAEISQSIAEREERDFQQMQRRAEAEK